MKNFKEEINYLLFLGVLITGVFFLSPGQNLLAQVTNSITNSVNMVVTGTNIPVNIDKLYLESGSASIQGSQISGAVKFSWTIPVPPGATVDDLKALTVGPTQGSPNYFASLATGSSALVPAAYAPNQSFVGIPLDGREVWVKLFFTVRYPDGTAKMQNVEYKYTTNSSPVLYVTTTAYSQSGCCCTDGDALGACAGVNGPGKEPAGSCNSQYFSIKAYCPAGYTVLSGSCGYGLRYGPISGLYGFQDGNGWRCRALAGSRSGSTCHSVGINAYVNCQLIIVNK